MEDALDDRLLAFIAVSIAVVVIPGPDMALVARNVVRHGRSAGFATSVGICTGLLGWAVAAALGVATLLAASATAFTVLKLAGAGYLIYLGITTLRADDAPPIPGATDGSGLPWHRAWLQGLLSAMLNPKLGVFFLTLLPQFIAPGDPPAGRALQLATIFEVIGLLWLVTYTLMLGALGAALSRPGPRRLMRWVTGTVLVGLGARVALERS
jgi:threonine/homoserine/homoserine lactone efflux protein